MALTPCSDDKNRDAELKRIQADAQDIAEGKAPRSEVAAAKEKAAKTK